MKTPDFIKIIQQVKRRVDRWPLWMRRNAVVAAASFPKQKSRLKTKDQP